MPCARGLDRGHETGPCPLQGLLARGPRAERGAGIRRLRDVGCCQSPPRERSAGARGAGVRRTRHQSGAPLVSRFFLTTAIDYVNNRPHLGTAYEKIAADVIARYKRLCGFDTRFLMGNDEHSQNVYKSAVEQGLDPLTYCDQMEQVFTRTWRHLEISFDDFIRTSEP